MATRYKFKIRRKGESDWFEVIVDGFSWSSARSNLEKQYPGANIEYLGTVD